MKLHEKNFYKFVTGGTCIIKQFAKKHFVKLQIANLQFAKKHTYQNDQRVF